ncbi:hypothetical protein [Fluviicola taffensis]|uniref:Lipoprotein n=1 Tax=Fluviicola taffensis (strain DSM 16823 / NCIMB 13979 / RW262) TaxID=755732 RepID=F2IAN2_FLUTR|nr:hypothetical protein [Fluviicola taffensis]AEA44187.1 hypothetical protein Fluta_2201 [Fluviicola taffensis DSM 16823]
MKNSKKSFFTILLGMGLLVVSCKKEGCTDSSASNYNEDAKKDNGSCTYPPVAQTGFTWKENGGSEMVADSAFWTTGAWGTGIRAYKGGMANFFEINWQGADNNSVGIKTLDSAYGFTFLKNSDSYTGTSGQTLEITAVSGNSISGNFSAPVTGGTITTVTGTFTSINKH